MSTEKQKFQAAAREDLGDLASPQAGQAYARGAGQAGIAQAGWEGAAAHAELEAGDREAGQ